MSPAVGAKKPEIMLKNVVLPAPFGPMMARSSPAATCMETSLTATRLPNRLVTSRTSSMVIRAPLACSMPRMPRGKNSTTSTKIRPTNDIQFTVIDEM